MPEPPNNQRLAERLKRGPGYLLVGQGWLRLGGRDPFLEQALRKFGSPNLTQSGYSSLFESSAGTRTPESLAWLHDRCTFIPIPEAFETVSEFSWNTVLTSAIDDVLIRGLRKPWREIQKVVSKDYQPTDPRSRSKLNVWCLFGSVAAADEEGWPPLTQLEFVSRKGTATVLADALADLISPLGVLFIESYEPSTDWLNSELFYQFCSKLSLDQAHLFSAGEDHWNNTFLKELVRAGKLTFHQQSLAQFLAEAAELGWIDLGQMPAETTFGQSIRIAEHVVTIPEQIFQRIHTTARLVTELAFAPLPKQSRDVRYSEFRNFLYQSSYRPEWEGYARGFAFRRTFQEELWQTARSRIENVPRRREPVVLHGPTGSGKTVALGQLAFDLQKEGKFPVVLIDRNVRQIKKEAIDQFCNWAEDQGATAVAVIWDGMMEPKEYRALDQYLRSRGRKCVVIGSCYQTDANDNMRPLGVQVKSEMNDEELHRFFDFLGTIEPDLPSRFVGFPRGKRDAESFLGNLYRYLPETRLAIQTGLGMEVAHAENLLVNMRLPVEQASRFGTSLADLLEKVGFAYGPKETFGSTVQTLGDEDASAVRRLIGFVMIPGSFGLPCPFELLVRALGTTPAMSLLPILERIDIFRIVEDIDGNPTVGPRSALEATLIAQRMMGGAKAEIDYATQLLSHLRGSSLTGQREIDFAVDLLRFLGPNGPNPVKYEAYFETLATCLSSLKGPKNVRLLLQESMLFREAGKTKADPDDSKRLLLRSIDVSTEGIEILAAQTAYRAMRSQFLVEMAATFGALAIGETDWKTRFSYLEKAHKHAFLAYSTDPTSHYPLDVIAWTADNVLSSQSLPDNERLKIIESVIHAFALADSEDWDASARVQLLKRRVQLGEKVFGAELTEQTFKALLSRGSAAGVVLWASQIGDDSTDREVSPQERQSRAAEALEFMEQYPDVVSSDPRALFLRFKFWWRKKTGMNFNEKERFAIPFSVQDWDECIRAVGELLSFEEFQTNLTLRLIEAVAFFHRAEYRRGFEAFEQLSAEQIFVRDRVVRRYLFSDSSGTPRRFSGTVTHIRENRDGLVAIPAFPKGVTFFARESGKSELRKGDDLSGFCVAFNMLGPIVDFRL